MLYVCFNFENKFKESWEKKIFITEFYICEAYVNVHLEKRINWLANKRKHLFLKR